MRYLKKKTVIAVILAGLVIALAAGKWIAQKDCVIVQYGDDSGNQGEFYTIRNQGKLIVVDGGWAANEAQVRRVLKKNGNQVYAWILTHPHPDHIGAFNAIWQDPQGVKIKHVYTVGMDYELYQKYAREWDEFDVYDTFVKITKGDERVRFVYAGDQAELCGLHMKVLSAYDADVPKLSKDLANDGSMMFTLKNREETILFCADVGVKMSEHILEKYAQDVKCDYIQMGHHGNGGLSEEFYRLTQPGTAFFDAPAWLMYPEDPDSKYTTPQNRELMESMGAAILDYQTAPNKIVLK